MTSEPTPPARAEPAPKESSSKTRRGPGFFKKLLILGIAAVVLALVSEWGLRVSNLERLSYMNPALYDPHETLGYRMKPDVRVYSHGAWFETNRAGFRGPHWNDSHDLGKECVMFLGHSIASGFGVTADEALPGVFTELNSAGLVGINVGHCGYRYWQEFPLAHEILEDVRPVATVVMFTGNDFEPQYYPFTSTNIRGAGADSGALPIPGKRWLRRHSVLYAYLRKRWNRLMVSVGRRESPPLFEYASLRGQDDESRAHFASYEEHLQRLKDTSGVPMVLTAFPMGQSPESYALLAAMAERVGARWIDFSDLWENVNDYRRNGALAWSEHPSAKTHRIMGERVTAVVEELIAKSGSR